MNTNDLNMALYEKMAAEQDKYRDWLKSQPPEEILHHTYEYTSANGEGDSKSALAWASVSSSSSIAITMSSRMVYS